MDIITLQNRYRRGQNDTKYRINFLIENSSGHPIGYCIVAKYTSLTDNAVYSMAPLLCDVYTRLSFWLKKTSVVCENHMEFVFWGESMTSFIMWLSWSDEMYSWYGLHTALAIECLQNCAFPYFWFISVILWINFILQTAPFSDETGVDVVDKYLNVA